MNGHSTNRNHESIHSHPHDWHRAIKVRKILFYFSFVLHTFRNRKEDVGVVLKFCCFVNLYIFINYLIL